MNTLWIVVADAARALVLARKDRAQLSLVHQLENPHARESSTQLASDGPGRIQKHASGVLSTMDPPTNPHENVAVEFAGRLNDLLETAAEKNEYQSLAVVAPAHFLGLVRTNMKPSAKRRLARCEPKDLTRLTLADLQTHFADWDPTRLAAEAPATRPH